jgi:hypothetical protein
VCAKTFEMVAKLRFHVFQRAMGEFTVQYSNMLLNFGNIAVPSLHVVMDVARVNPETSSAEAMDSVPFVRLRSQ